MLKRTDMAIEFYSGTKRRLTEKITRCDIKVDAELSRRIGRPQGKYITIESDLVFSDDNEDYRRLAAAISDGLKEFSQKKCKLLYVGLGNPNLTADSLGSNVFERLWIGDGISAICPNVMGVTGIESFDVIKGVADRIRPDLILAVDSLAAASTERIATAFQISSTGITPGSGVSNHRMRLSEETLGCKVISLGVPLVIYASTLISDAAGDDSEEILAQTEQSVLDLIVTPKDIDYLVQECSSVIAAAINHAFG